MADIRTVGIRELKNNLSAWLREVRRGVRVLVSDRDAVVAELHEPTATYATGEFSDPVLAGWIREGTLVPPARPKRPLPESPVRLPEGSAMALLEQDRGEAGS